MVGQQKSWLLVLVLVPKAYQVHGAPGGIQTELMFLGARAPIRYATKFPDDNLAILHAS